MTTPKSLQEAVSRARGLLSAEDRKLLRDCSLEEAGWKLHMTAGLMLRNELGLWSLDTEALFVDMNVKMPRSLVVDGDSASEALIEALWHDARSG